MKCIALSLSLFSLNSFASQNNDNISILNKTNYTFDLQYNGKLFAQKIEPRKHHLLTTNARTSHTRHYIALIWHERNQQREIFFAQPNIHNIVIDVDKSGETNISVYLGD